jgi:hypothetical protein
MRGETLEKRQAEMRERMSAQKAVEKQEPLFRQPVMFERHFSAAELAEYWHVAPSTIRDWFDGEPGVLRIQKSRGSRVTLRIPESVAERVYKSRTGISWRH